MDARELQLELAAQALEKIEARESSREAETGRDAATVTTNPELP